MMHKKNTFLTIFIMAAIILAVLPFVTTFNELLTRLVENTRIYQFIEKVIVPWEVRLVGVLLLPFNIKFLAVPKGMIINDVYIHISWNCIGWQGLVLLVMTFFGGFQGNYTRLSKLEAIVIGLLGTFLVNLFRITITVLLGVYSNQILALIFHDYFAAFVFIIWLIVFWWFVYTFVLEEVYEVDTVDSSPE